MARGVNKVILIGHLGQDPDMKYTTGGASIANLSMATTRAWKDKDSGEKHEQTEWHKIVLFGAIAEIAEKYLKKGGQAYIEGRLQTRKYEDREGVTRYTAEIVGEQLQLLGGRGDADRGRDDPGGGSVQAYAKASGSSGQRTTPPKQQRLPDASQDFDDDIPF